MPANKNNSHHDFLVEIHTEEMPPKSLNRLAASFCNEIELRLEKAEFGFTETQWFATPRRLAVIVKKLVAKQADSAVERRGPAIGAAFDSAGKPTPACLGFARSCGVEPSQLITLKTPQGEWVGFKQIVLGKNVKELLPEIMQQAIAALPIPKRMRWGDRDVEFIRPVHSVIMLYGKDVIKAEILGKKTDRKTQGHRFLSKGWINVANPKQYLKLLKSKCVIACVKQRKELVRAGAQRVVPKKNGATIVMNENLLDEVTNLVEWPVAICGQFDESFLQVPQEALMSAMQDHQRYFPVVDKRGKLLPYFITISNIKSKNVKQVIAGNERVLRARLSDAAFFFEQDKKQRLQDRIDKLKHSVFQAKLGTLHDKAERLSALSAKIAGMLHENTEQAARAGLLAKTDLVTEMVGEFPELQGIAGYYYAKHDNEPAAIAEALREQYMPRFSGDELPHSQLGCVLALADRLDTLVGVFGINQAPTGDKDPFGLRRAALGVLRILIEKKLNLDLRILLETAAKTYTVKLENPRVVEDVFNFMQERLKFWYQEQNITADVFAAVAALNITQPYDMHCRIQAVQAFKKIPEAESLSVANKRVSNILAKYDGKFTSDNVNAQLFESDAERALAAKLAEQRDEIILLSKSAKYAEVLKHLAKLRKPVDDFFEHVLVMTDDKSKRENRLLLLKKLRELFLHVADIALLQP